MIILLVGNVVLVQQDAGFHRYTFWRQLAYALDRLFRQAEVFVLQRAEFQGIGQDIVKAQHPRALGIRRKGRHLHLSQLVRPLLAKALFECLRLFHNTLADSIGIVLHEVYDVLHIRPNSYESYLNTYEVHVKPYFEKKKLKLGDVTARVVMQYVRTKEDAGLSRKSIRKHLVILNGVFTEAIAMGELNYNP